MTLFLLLLSACSTVPIALNPEVGSVTSSPLPLKTAVVLPQSTKNFVLKRRILCLGVAQIPLGQELERGVRQVFSRAFEEADFYQLSPAGSDYDAVIEIKLVKASLTARCGLSASAAFQIELAATLRTKEGQELWQKTFVTPQPVDSQNVSLFYRSAFEEYIGRVVSASLSYALGELSRTVLATPELKELAEAPPQTPPEPPTDVDTPPSIQVATRQNAYAVIIGIEHYRDLPRADYAVRDAKAMREYLVRAFGYPEKNIVFRMNGQASLTDLEKYLGSWLKNNVDKDSSVFVYYSGHGAPSHKTGEAYLVPYDGDLSYLEDTAYPLRNLYESLHQLPTDQIFVMLDSCFSGAGGRSVIAKGTRPILVTVENPLLASDKIIVLAASQHDQISTSYPEKKHGLLTYFFLKGIKGNADADHDRSIQLSELFSYVKNNVITTARKINNVEQTPQLFPPLESLGGKARQSLTVNFLE